MLGEILAIILVTVHIAEISATSTVTGMVASYNKIM